MTSTRSSACPAVAARGTTAGALTAAIALLLAGAGPRVVSAPLAADAALQGQPAPSPRASQEAAEAAAQKSRWAKEHSNWGRWGKDDELGTLNLITPAKRRQALALARTGTVVSLMRPIVMTEMPAAIKAENRPATLPFFDARFQSYYPPQPAAGYSFDMQSFAYHGSVYTHVDGLCHVSYDDRLYNGYLQREVVDPEKGCSKMGIQGLKQGIVTRGILIDFPRLRGVSSLPETERLRQADVEAWEKRANVRISSGDAIFLRTGGTEGAPPPAVNYDPSIVAFLKARDVALIGADRVSADHQLTITTLGAYLIDNADLGPLADTAGRLNRWEFLLVVSPIPTPGGTGSIANPLAFF